MPERSPTVIRCRLGRLGLQIDNHPVAGYSLGVGGAQWDRRKMEAGFVAKAEENIRAAEILFRQELYNASANRAYYAALHAAVGALARSGFQLERIDHDKVQANFSGELIRRKKAYPGHLKSYLMDLQTVRNIADYRATPVSKKVSRRQLSRAREYVEALREEPSDVQ